MDYLIRTQMLREWLYQRQFQGSHAGVLNAGVLNSQLLTGRREREADSKTEKIKKNIEKGKNYDLLKFYI